MATIDRNLILMARESARDGQMASIMTALSEVEKGPSAWETVCDEVARFFGAIGALLLPLDPEFRGVWLTQSSSLKKVTEAYILGRWHLNDYRQNGQEMLLEHKIFTDDDLGRRSSLTKLPYYSDFLIPHGLGFAACVEIEVQGRHFGLSIQFPHDRAPFSEKEIAAALEIRDAIMKAASKVTKSSDDRLSDFLELTAESVDEVAIFDVKGNLTAASEGKLSIVSSIGVWPFEQIEIACAADPRIFEPQYISLESGKFEHNFTILQLPSSLRHFFRKTR